MVGPALLSACGHVLAVLDGHHVAPKQRLDQQTHVLGASGGQKGLRQRSLR